MAADQTMFSPNMNDQRSSPPAQSQFQSNHPASFPSTPDNKGSGRMSSSYTTTPSIAAESKKPLDISNLMSPPEPVPFDNFQQNAAMRQAMPEKRAAVPSAPLSPPISPFTQASGRIEAPGASITVASQDPILYPSSETSSSPPRPLFPSSNENAFEIQRTVDEHIAARPDALFGRVAPPSRNDYEMILYFKSKVIESFHKNPDKWLRRERNQLKKDQQARNARKQQLQPILPASRPAVVRPAAARVTKPEKVKHRVSRLAPTRIAPQSTSAPRQSSVRLPSATPEPRSRPVAPNREDKDFASLPDYSPPLDSLPAKANSLKVDWKGNPLDLSKDPFRDLLHPDEIHLAAGLRLDCATYLTSKRRIFMRRLECARIPKEFRKTDAQQACKIDVNKASKLWTAYDKVGWLEVNWMRPHINSAH